MSHLNLKKLCEPFPPEDIEWRVQSCGQKQKSNEFWVRVLAYVTNRAIMERLDEVCGQENWKNVFESWTVGDQHGVLCGLSIRVNDEWITKYDGAENTDIEAIKGGISSAMKRAAVQWGIGRYLYDLEEGWGVPHENGQYWAKTRDGNVFRWNPPALPVWALPPRTKPAVVSEESEGIATSLAGQHQLIMTLAAQLDLDVASDILGKMKITWPPNKHDADRILKRLHELKHDKAKTMKNAG